MKKDILVFVRYLSIIVPVLALAAGAYYFISLQQAKKASVDAATSRIQASLVPQQASPAQVAADLAQAKATLAADTTRLAALTNSVQSAITPLTTADIKKAYTTDHSAVLSTDILFKNAQTTSPKLIVKTSAAIQAQIDLLRAQITKTFALWWALVTNTTSTGVVDPRVIAEEQQYASDIQSYINDLKKITDGLTPGNSGLSQAQIDAYQAAVDSAVDQANGVVKSIDAAEQGQSGGNTPPQVQYQQNIVNQDQAQVNALQNALNQSVPSTPDVLPSAPPIAPTQDQTPGATGGDSGVTPPADTTPPASDVSAPLHLIEGTNPI